MNDSEIEEKLTAGLLQFGWIKIGELDTFYCKALKLDTRSKAYLQAFAESLLRSRAAICEVITVQQTALTNETFERAIGDMAKGLCCAKGLN